MAFALVTYIPRSFIRRYRYVTVVAMLTSVFVSTFVLLSWYQTSGGPRLKYPYPYVNNYRRELPSLQQEITKRNLQKIVEEFWMYLKTEIKSLTIDKSLKNSSSERQLLKLVENIDDTSYKRWMYIKDEKSMCLKAISKWKNMRKDLLNIEKSSVLKSIGLLIRNVDDFPRLIERELGRLTDDVEAPSGWREQESKELGQIVHKHMYALQNPSNCANVKKLACQYEKKCGTGFGCQVHHVSSCLVLAYATNRTLVFNRGHWIYNSEWESVFLPFKSKCTIEKESESTAKFGDVGWENKQVVHVPHLHNQTMNITELLPPAIPAQMADRLMRFHGFPHVWWVGQFLRYAMRGQPEFDKLLSDTLHNLNFTHPIVGVHIRRTDKLREESQLFQVEEYMYHVTRWYTHYERWTPHTGIEKKVFVATDEPSLLKTLAEKYPGYVFIYDSSRSGAAAVKNRRSESGFTAITLDITLLSLTDFLVCTFSSNVGRTAYALMQTRTGDASQSVVSLDKAYFYTGQNPYKVRAIANHTAKEQWNNLAEQQTLSRVIKYQNGFLRGRTESFQLAIVPAFKTVDVIKRVNMPRY